MTSDVGIEITEEMVEAARVAMSHHDGEPSQDVARAVLEAAMATRPETSGQLHSGDAQGSIIGPVPGAARPGRIEVGKSGAPDSAVVIDEAMLASLERDLKKLCPCGEDHGNRRVIVGSDVVAALVTEVRRLRGDPKGLRKALPELAAIDGWLRELQRARRYVAALADFSDALERSLPERYACRLCGASPDGDHRQDCEVEISSAAFRRSLEALESGDASS